MLILSLGRRWSCFSDQRNRVRLVSSVNGPAELLVIRKGIEICKKRIRNLCNEEKFRNFLIVYAPIEKLRAEKVMFSDLE